uniref:Uncharacterized protein n=1 Tax=Tanacetum cinerariifolium TaxID=118510 RepID=A0A699GRZ2_TANCI|nr:hypothetical protein [Tanacetum cinerariifolium]
MRDVTLSVKDEYGSWNILEAAKRAVGVGTGIGQNGSGLKRARVQTGAGSNGHSWDKWDSLNPLVLIIKSLNKVTPLEYDKLSP